MARQEIIAESTDEPRGIDIAIVGMACRLPGATTPQALWTLLEHGQEPLETLSREELRQAGMSEAELEDPDFVPMVHPLADIDVFDADYFGFAPGEAALLDPQQRLFMTCAVEALEAAGLGDPERRGPVGLYAGASTSTYLHNNLLASQTLKDQHGLFSLFLQGEKDFIATRTSYKLNLTGPSVSLHTACSTSLVAVHLACQALLEGECEVALAGGSSVRAPQRMGYRYQPDMIFSPDGRCRPFDANAQGTVASSGVAVVALMRREEALARGIPIHALIRSTAINNDGAQKIGYTAPSSEGQARVIQDALQLSGISADSIGFVEAHGTGTSLGDPIEVKALTRAYRADTQARQYCALGSIKSNLGHLDTAAGATSLLKTVLALKHGQVPPTLHFETPNPALNLETSPFFVNAGLIPFPRPAGDHVPCRAAVSSFGFGGTNAHVILEALEPSPSATVRPVGPSTPQLLLLSARTEEGVLRASESLAQALEQSQPPSLHASPHTSLALSLEAVAYTLQVGRQGHPVRRRLVAATVQEAIDALRNPDPQRLSLVRASASVLPVAFLFPGGGAHYPAMGAELYATEPVYRDAIDAGLACLPPGLQREVRSVLLPPADGIGAALAARLEDTRLGLPALFLTEYALARTLLHLGLSPDVLVGHSLGEYTAACLAGIFSLEDAMTLVHARGRLMASLNGEGESGGMLAVTLAEQSLREKLTTLLSPAQLRQVAIAAINGPTQCTLSGWATVLQHVQTLLEADEVEVLRLPITVAAHSPMLEPILEPFRAVVRSLVLRPPKARVISSRTGRMLTAQEATDPEYWVQHLRHTVRFTDALSTLLAQQPCLLLEVGPGRGLTGFCQNHPAYAQQPVVLSMRPARESGSDRAALLSAVGRCWSLGARVKLEGLWPDPPRRAVLPTYPFAQTRYWVTPDAASSSRERSSLRPESPPRGGLEIPRLPLDQWFSVPGWKQVPSAPTPSPSGFWILLESSDAPYAQTLRQAQVPERSLCVVRPSTSESGQVDMNGASQPGGAAPIRSTGAITDTVRLELRADPKNLNDFIALTAWLEPILRAWLQRQSEQAPPLQVVYAWGVDARLAESPTALEGLLHLTQALAQLQERLSWPGPIRVQVVTRGRCSVLGEAPASPMLALLSTFVKVAALELPEWQWQSVDLPRSTADAAPDWAAGWRALPHSARWPELVFRQGFQWVPTWESVSLGDSATAAPSPGTHPWPGGFTPGATTLITGGLGGIGLELAQLLADHEQGTLILVSRKPPPAPDALPTPLRALTHAGAILHVFQADVTNPQEIDRLMEDLKRQGLKVNRLIHAAGLPGGGAILLQTAAQLRQTLAPKVEGIENLCRGLLGNGEQAHPLRSILLCSALASVAGAFGHVDYACANGFLDAFALEHSLRTGIPTLSLQWDRWRGTGMALQTEALHRRMGNQEGSSAERSSAGLTGISPEEGRWAFAAVLTHLKALVPAAPVASEQRCAPGYAQLVISSQAVEDVVASVKAQVAHPMGQTADATSPHSPERALHRMPGIQDGKDIQRLRHSTHPPEDHVQEVLVDLLEMLLGVQPVGIRDSFFELGGNSLMGTRLLAHLRERLGVSLSLRMLLDAPTAEGLARHIHQKAGTTGSLRALLIPLQPAAAELSNQTEELEEGSL